MVLVWIEPITTNRIIKSPTFRDLNDLELFLNYVRKRSTNIKVASNSFDLSYLDEYSLRNDTIEVF